MWGITYCATLVLETLKKKNYIYKLELNNMHKRLIA